MRILNFKKEEIEFYDELKCQPIKSGEIIAEDSENTNLIGFLLYRMSLLRNLV